MGRFRLREDEDDDDDLGHDGRRGWEFVAENGAEGSMVEYHPNSTNLSHSAQQQQSTGFSQHGIASANNGQGQPTVYYVIPEESYRHLRDSRRSCCHFSPLFQFVFISVIAVVIYYIQQHGPPAPPRQSTCLSLMGIHELCLATDDDHSNETDVESLQTWKEYMDKHNAALYRSLKAYLVDTTLHVLSWIVPQMLSDVTHFYQELRDWLFPQAAKRCKLALHRPPDNLNELLLEQFPTTPSQPHAFLPMVQKLDATLWNDVPHDARLQGESKSLVFWATQLTSGLAMPEFCKKLAELVLPQCPIHELPYVVLDGSTVAESASDEVNPHGKDNTEEPETLKWINRIQTDIRHWKGGGGMVVLQHADKLPSRVLLRLLELWQSENTLVSNDIVSTHFNTQNVVLVLTSINTVGSKAMGRHVLIKDGNISNILKSALALDIRDEIAAWLSSENKDSERQGALAMAEKVEVIPLWYLTQDSMVHALNVMMKNLAEALGLDREGLGITPAVQDEILGEKRIEWLGLKSLESTTRVSSEGIDPVLNQMTVLEAKLKKHCSKSLDTKHNEYLLDYRQVDHQMILSLSSMAVCSFHFV